MEKQIALVDKESNRVINILIVDSFEDEHIQSWSNEKTLVVPVTDSPAFLYGLYDGNSFLTPEKEYLIEIGIIKTDDSETAISDITIAKAALLEKLGITEEEAKLLLS